MQREASIGLLGDTMQTKKQTRDNAAVIRSVGMSDGKAIGSWVIDGNTRDETCRKILKQIEDGDPALQLPELQLGQWAGDPAFADILHDADIELDEDCPDEHEDELFSVYSDGWYEGMQNEVERACRSRLESDNDA
jgi:hypothetical protein